MDPKNKNEEAPSDSLEVLMPSALEAMERAHIDVQISTAHRFPRSLEIFKKRAISMATLDEETAESCIYTRPVGKEKNERGQWVEKFAEGSSIRLAEIVAASYGNIRVAARIVEQTERYVKCEGVAHDLETNYAGKAEVIEPTVKQDGTPYSERQRALMAKVCIAKAYRDAVFKVVPKALCKTAFDAAKAICAGTGKTIEERQKRVRAWLTSIKISDERVFAALGVNGWSEIGEEKLLTLTGLKTSISDGDTKVDEAFPPIAKTPAASGPAETAATSTVSAATIDEQQKLLEKPYETIQSFCKRDSITEAQVLSFAKEKKMTAPATVELLQVSDAKMRDMIKNWSNILPAIKTQPMV